MKKEQGITLISLIIYILLMTFVVGAVAIITSSFRSNLNELDNSTESIVSFSKFNMYFLKDIKRNEIDIEEYYDDYLILSYLDENQNSRLNVEYSNQNNSLYRNKIKICDNVKNMQITVDDRNNTITIELEIDQYKKATTYAIENKLKTNDMLEI